MHFVGLLSAIAWGFGRGFVIGFVHFIGFVSSGLTLEDTANQRHTFSTEKYFGVSLRYNNMITSRAKYSPREYLGPCGKSEEDPDGLSDLLLEMDPVGCETPETGEQTQARRITRVSFPSAHPELKSKAKPPPSDTPGPAHMACNGTAKIPKPSHRLDLSNTYGTAKGYGLPTQY